MLKILRPRYGFMSSVGTGAIGLLMSQPWVLGQPLQTKQIERTPPNIVLIVADDLGYAELGSQGCMDIPTPNIDSIAQSGVRFTQAYVTCAVCAPSRAGLLTGRYPQRFGFETNPGPEAFADDKFGLPLTEITLAERLRTMGYATGMVGKWHLGYKPELTPTKRGFDEFFGFLGGAHNYLSGVRRSEILRNLETVHEQEYLTDAFGREAVQFIHRHKEQPFFLYLPFNAVHTPMEAPDKYRDRTASIKDANRRIYAGMTIAMDNAVGQVLDKLRNEKLEENTLIFFISDNGGPTHQTTSSNSPLRGYKSQLWEGGIRVPFLVQWKGQIPAGKVYDDPVISLDIVPTVIAATGKGLLPEDNLDGVNLMPYLAGDKKGKPHDVLYWRYQSKHAIRMNDWKLVKEYGSLEPELYNLAEDVSETKDLAQLMPDKVTELEIAWNAWNDQLQSPMWKRQDARTENRRATNQPTEVRRGVDVENRFRQMDRNGDGVLSKDEIERPGLLRLMDQNGDGVVTKEEANATYTPTNHPTNGQGN